MNEYVIRFIADVPGGHLFGSRVMRGIDGHLAADKLINQLTILDRGSMSNIRVTAIYQIDDTLPEIVVLSQIDIDN